MANKIGNLQPDQKNNNAPPYPSKWKDTIQIEDEAESSKNQFEILESQEPDQTKTKENMEGNPKEPDTCKEN